MNVLHMHDVIFKVNLTNGSITTVTHEEEGPYGYYKYFVKANYISLGILLQNIHEQKFKLEKADEWVETQSSNRRVLGSTFNVDYEDMIQTRDHIYKEYNEYFI